MKGCMINCRIKIGTKEAPMLRKTLKEMLLDRVIINCSFPNTINILIVHVYKISSAMMGSQNVYIIHDIQTFSETPNFHCLNISDSFDASLGLAPL